MISPDILARLVPPDGPKADFPFSEELRRIGPDGPAFRIGLWSAYLRFAIAQEASKEGRLRNLIETSGFVGVGIFRVFNQPSRLERPFPVIEGLQFGAMLFRGVLSEGETYVANVRLGGDQVPAPVVQTLATFNDHAHWADGYTSAIYEMAGKSLGITARHVVEGYRIGQRVPVACSACEAPARLVRKAPGLIDAAIVRFDCGGPGHTLSSKIPVVRRAVETETVDVHLGITGKKSCTVMQSLSTPSQILSAATPKHFLLEQFGVDGDSGSPVSGPAGGSNPADLIGMYLGDCDCEDATGSSVTYGYGLDLGQAAAVFGAKDLKGDFK
jgi:hypothetical protein